MGVAATAALGILAGVGVTVLSGAPSGDQGAPAASRSVPLPTATLPAVTPVTGREAAAELPSSTLSLASKFAVPAVEESSAPVVAPLKRTLTADLIVVAPSTLPHSALAAISALPDVVAAEPVEAIRMRVNGTYTAVLGVDASGFREFAATATARSDALWRGVAGGGIAVSYTMGQQDKLPLGGTLTASGATARKLKIVAFGTLGISGVDAVISHQVARSLGAPADNAIVVSIRGTGISGAASAVGKLLPRGAGVQQLVSIVTSSGSSTGAAGAGSPNETSVPAGQLNIMLAAAMSRRGLPYVWGGNGPNVFDCSGLVKWSFAQAGITMPRVAADQALTGPSVPVSQLQPGDLLFYHTDASAPNYISHVTIYLGNGWMIQAPHTGAFVEVVPAAFGSEFAGAVRVNPAQAASVAAHVA